MNKKDHALHSGATYPPVVAVLGHVDHGKTTLLDTIRKTNIALGEHGGITQRIGASSIEIIHEGKKSHITFIDTPGHEAFSKMRSRGTQAADIGLLVVSVVDGVMPQTKESITLLKDAGVPLIVVLTKSDAPQKNPEKVKQQLLKEGILLEGLGGDVPYIMVSAKTGSNIKELLELILLVNDLHKTDGKEGDLGTLPLKAIVIESRLDEKAGPKTTVIVKNGSIAIRDELASDGVKARVRMLADVTGKRVDHVTVGEAAEVLGFERVPPVGALVRAANVAVVPKEDVPARSPVEPPELGIASFVVSQEAALSLVIVTDTLGSLEAIINALPQEVAIIEKKTGDITPADVLLAKSIGGAIVIGFNVKIRPDVAHLARTEKVLLKNYTIIYELLSEVQDVLAGNILAMQEEILGKAKVLASFPYEKSIVLGVAVLEGRIAKGDRVRLMRGEEIVGQSTITSLRQGKNPISKVEHGHEAGVILASSLDFTIGDVLLSHG